MSTLRVAMNVDREFTMTPRKSALKSQRKWGCWLVWGSPFPKSGVTGAVWAWIPFSWWARMRICHLSVTLGDITLHARDFNLGDDPQF